MSKKITFGTEEEKADAIAQKKEVIAKCEASLAELEAAEVVAE